MSEEVPGLVAARSLPPCMPGISNPAAPLHESALPEELGTQGGRSAPPLHVFRYSKKKIKKKECGTEKEAVEQLPRFEVSLW